MSDHECKHCGSDHLEDLREAEERLQEAQAISEEECECRITQTCKWSGCEHGVFHDCFAYVRCPRCLKLDAYFRKEKP